MSQVLLVGASLLAGVSLAGCSGAGVRTFVRLREAERRVCTAAGDDRAGGSAWRLALGGLGRSVARRLGADVLPRLDRLVERAGLQRERSGAEILGRCVFLGAAGLFTWSLLLGLVLGPAGLVAGVVLGSLMGLMPWSTLRGHAETRARYLVADLPYALDLMTLCVTAGGSLGDAMRAVVATSPRSPLSEELGLAQRELELGRTGAQALGSLARRVQQPLVDDIVRAFLQAEELGTPLAAVLGNLADSARTRRYERAERAASESAVRMMGPSMLIMISVVILILGPILLTLGDATLP